MVLPLLLLIGHAGNPALATVTAPEEMGTIVDDSFVVTWRDLDMPIPTGTATVNLYYVRERPPTFFEGEIPTTLTGTVIAEGIFEQDLDNTFVWDTSAVPSGTYWIWSRVDEPPEPEQSPQIISFSPAPLHVQHPGDPIGPSVRITRPGSLVEFANEGFEIEYEAFAPNGPATVRIEVGRSLAGENFQVLADGLAATSTGSFYWDTEEVAEADWLIRAVITDDTGSFSTYCPFFLLVTHFGPPPDAGPRPDTGSVDSGRILPDAGQADTGVTPEPDPDCGCSTAAHAGEPMGWLLLLLVWRRRGR